MPIQTWKIFMNKVKVQVMNRLKFDKLNLINLNPIGFFSSVFFIVHDKEDMPRECLIQN